MRVAARLARLERARGAGPCTGCEAVRIVHLVKPGKPMPTNPGLCRTCGRQWRVRVTIIDPANRAARPPAPTPGAAPVGPRSPVGGPAPAGVAVGGEPPSPPDRPRGAPRGE